MKDINRWCDDGEKISVFSGRHFQIFISTKGKTDFWQMDCPFLGFSCESLGTTDRDQARLKAINIVCDYIELMINGIKEGK